MEVECIQFCTLEKELSKAKQTLVILNDNIRRIIGRDPKDTHRYIPNRKRIFEVKPIEKNPADPDMNENNVAHWTQRPRDEQLYETKRMEIDNTGPKEGGSSVFVNKRRCVDSKSVFNRLSTSTIRITTDETRPRLNSRVIRELPSRQEIVAAQCSDAESRARNRRMFGSLLGTLHKFCVEETRLKQKEEKKAMIEKKLEEQELQEKESMKKEREMLFVDRKRKQLEIRKLELKMSRLRDFETWEASQKNLKNHIRTRVKPHIYFRPRVLNKVTEMMLADSRTCLRKELTQRKEVINKEIVQIEEKFKFQEGNFENSTTHSNVSALHDTGKQKLSIETVKDVSGPDHMSVKSDFDCKENQVRSVNGPSITSSVVVIQKVSSVDA